MKTSLHLKPRNVLYLNMEMARESKVLIFVLRYLYIFDVLSVVLREFVLLEFEGQFCNSIL